MPFGLLMVEKKLGIFYISKLTGSTPHDAVATRLDRQFLTEEIKFVNSENV